MEWECRITCRRERQNHEHHRVDVKYTSFVPIRGAPRHFVHGAEDRFETLFGHRVMHGNAHCVEDRLESHDLFGRRQEAS
jgi:hypothetical protein